MKTMIYLMIILSVGCATTSIKPPIETKIVEVKVPVIQCPIPPHVPFPDLYISKLSKKDANDWDKIAKYYVITLKQLMKYSSDLDSILQTYRESPPKSIE
jgi:hypothetical protein